jgi:hypothetical protein
MVYSLDTDEHRRRLFKILVKDYSPGEEYKPLVENDNLRIIEQNSKFDKKFKIWMIDYKIHISPNTNININQVNDVHFSKQSLLIYDSARAHITEDVKKIVKRYSQIAVIPEVSLKNFNS